MYCPRLFWEKARFLPIFREHITIVHVSLILLENRKQEHRVVSPFFRSSMPSEFPATRAFPFSTLSHSASSPIAPCEIGGSLIVGHVNPPSSSRGTFFVKKLTTTMISPLVLNMTIAAKKEREKNRCWFYCNSKPTKMLIWSLWTPLLLFFSVVLL